MAEKDGQPDEVARKPNRDSPLRARSAEKVGQRSSADTGRTRLLALSLSGLMRARGAHVVVVVVVVLLSPF